LDKQAIGEFKMQDVNRLGLFVAMAITVQSVLATRLLIQASPPAHPSPAEFASRFQRDDTPLTGLAADLVTAKDDDERAVLIEKHSESIDVSLRKVLIRHAFHLCLRGDYSHSLDVVHVLELLAAHKGDNAWMAVPAIGSVVVYYLQGNLAKAIESYRKLPPIAEIEHDPAATAWVLSIRGFLAYFRGNYSQALKDCGRSLELFDPVQDKSEIAFTLTSAGMVHSAQGEHTKALDYYQRALSICRQTGDMSLAVVPLNNIGVVYHERLDDEKALEFYKQSLTLGRQLGINSSAHYTLNNMGDAYFRLGDCEHAMDSFTQSLDLRRKLGNKAEIAITLKDIGEIHIAEGHFDQALSAYQESLQLDQAIGDKVAAADRLEHIGLAYLNQQNYRPALEYFDKRLAISQALDDKEGIGDAFAHISRLYSDQNSMEIAVDYMRKSFDARKATGKKELLANAFSDLGSTQMFAGDLEDALNNLQDALLIYQELGHKYGIAHTLFRIGEVNARAGSSSTAIDYYQKSLDIAQTINDRPLLFPILAQMAYTRWLQKDYSLALELAERAAALASQFRSAETAREWTAGLEGLIYRSLDQPDKARMCFRDAIAGVENVRGEIAGSELDLQRYFEGQVRPYYEMIDLLVSHYRVTEAFSYAERAKARVVLDVLQNGRVNPARLMTPAEHKQEQQLQDQITSLNNQIYRQGLLPQARAQHLAQLKSSLQATRHSLEAFHTSLYAAHPDLRVARGETAPIDLRQVAAAIPDPDTALLEYVVGEKRTLLFVATVPGSASNRKCDLKVYSVDVTRNELIEKVAGYRQMLADHGLGFRKPASELSELLLGPAQPLLKTLKRLVIVPDGPLWDLPFQTLQLASGRFLLEDFALCYAPSVTALLEMSRTRNRRRSASEDSSTLLAVGNPAVSPESTTRSSSTLRAEKPGLITEAEQEVVSIAGIYGEAKSKVLVGPLARENVVKAEAPKFRILHFATHGKLDDASPLYSYLVLAQPDTPPGQSKNPDGTTRPPDTDDGLLEAWEVMQMELKADLVVLSACETGRGRPGSGEGVVGMSWAFFVAGAPAIVVSQWKVDSDTSASLMVDFHRNLTANMTRAEALRQAALKLLHTEQYRHPFYWAPFIVVGDGL
jgi:CHAT domain-containing protein/Tfp pilus assembly protein PilF